MDHLFTSPILTQERDPALLRGYESMNDFYHSILSHHVDPTNRYFTAIAQLMLAIRQVNQDADLFSKFVSFIAPLDHPGNSAHNVTQRLVHVLVNNENAVNKNMAMTNTFLSFLGNPSGSSPFSHLALAHDQLATMCLNIMLHELQFDICKFPSSFVLNQEVHDLTARAESAISSRLRYGCRYWTDHVGQLVEIHSEMVEQISDFFETKFFFWLEVMSVLKLQPAQSLRTLSSTNVSYSLL